MSVTPISLVFALMGGLVLAAILGWIRRPRLVVVVPRLFGYSHLTNRGNLVEISIFNRSMKTEESIELSLSKSLSFELVGANSQDVVLNEQKLIVPRIGAGDDLTVLLLVEGGQFSNADILSCLSKETKGKVVSGLENVPPTASQRVGLVAFLVVIPLAIFAAYHFSIDPASGEKKGSETSIKKENNDNSPINGESDIDAELRKNRTIREWLVPAFYEQTSKRLYKEFESGNIAVMIGNVSKKRDIASIPFYIHNNSSLRVRISVSMETNGSEERIPSYKRRFSDILVVPDFVIVRSIDVVIPEKPRHPSDNVVYIEVFITADDGDTLSVKRDYVVR